MFSNVFFSFIDYRFPSLLLTVLIASACIPLAETLDEVIMNHPILGGFPPAISAAAGSLKTFFILFLVSSKSFFFFLSLCPFCLSSSALGCIGIQNTAIIIRALGLKLISPGIRPFFRFAGISFSLSLIAAIIEGLHLLV